MLTSVASDTKRGTNGTAADKCSDAIEEISPIGFIHFSAVQAVKTVLVELSTDFDALVTEAALDPRLFDDSSSFVPFTALGRLIALAAERTCCPHLGLLAGQRTTLTSLGLLGLLLRNSETVGDALRVLEAHLYLWNRGAVAGLVIHDDTAIFTYVPYEPGAEGTALHSERALAKVTVLLRSLCGAGWDPHEVLLPRSPPRDTGPYATFFRAPVRFDQEVAALVFSAAILDLPIVGADPAVCRKAEDRVRKLRAADPSSLTDELRQYLYTAMSQQRCKAERVARLRLVTRRTLNRHLRAEGTTFKKLSNEAQFRVAKQLLADTCMSLTQISIALSFSEPAAFTHAFRRWSGMTPSAWRRTN